ncbi:MAG TPA: PRC-barrel domain-containing protein [Actinomycetes bacterium]|nr:PRC-barrel domain-containing protein [Actinomycetes bacterium]
MAAFDPATLDRWRALAIVDRDGTTVGTISEFYLDRETGHPTWALVNTGLFGATQTFVPLVHATEISDGLQVPYEKRHIKDAPPVDTHDELTPAEEATLFAHYGVEYEPTTEAAEVPAEPGAVEAAETTVAEGAGPVPADPESGASEELGPVDGPGPVPAEPGSPAPASTEAVDGRAGSASPEPTETVLGEPATDEATGRRDGSAPDATDGSVPREPGTADPDEARRVDQQGLGAEGLEPEELGSASQPPEAPAEGDRDLSRTAPVEPGLPGSTAADPFGPAPTTMDKGAHPSEQPEEEPVRSPDEAPWPGPAGAFEEQVPLDRPPGSSDRWREAKQAAERERIARAASTPPEERSPLERARRRLERLVGVGQEHPDEDSFPTDRDAAERARRARLDLEEDDDPRR